MTNHIGRREFLVTATAVAATPMLGACAPGGAPAATIAPPVPVRMDRRRLGRLEVSSLGLGVQNNARKYDTTTPYRPEQVRLIQAAYDQGVRFFDTAEAYGPFECERILGDAMRSFRNDIVITTKYGWNIDPVTGQRVAPMLNSRPDHIKRVVEQSLGRLRTDRIDLLYQHRVDPQVPIEDVAGAIQDLMREGKVLHWGLSEPGLQTIRRAHATLPLTAIQNEYSMFSRGYERDVIPLCEELGIGFVPWSPLGQQFLTGYVDGNTRFAPTDLRSSESRFAPENLPHNLQLVSIARQWAERKGVAPAAIALAWLLAQRPWIVPIPGTTHLAHLSQNIAAANVRFTSSELAELNSAVRAVEIRGQRLPDAVLQYSLVEAPPKR
jgi:aryl-alcohol dehydrogenase-like predicted oxidoreductase